MDLGLKDRVALVTGGSQGIGRAAAILLAREGAKVAITFRERQEAAAAVTAEIERMGARGNSRGRISQRGGRAE